MIIFHILAGINDLENHETLDTLDEAQDISVPQLRFLAALSEGRPNSLLFAGDWGQRIFQQA